ncbi:uncharacterized protein [Lepisosteus oculatus]|uniref:uncharacterized protein isoform X3 n=1 Tax=Lepisosteus oculatus TaxID=7918 RepID=UPI0035F52C44
MAKKKKGKGTRTNAKQGSVTDVPIILRRFLRTYENHCAQARSSVSPTIKQSTLRCIENEKIMTKITLAFPEYKAADAPPKSLQPLLMTIRDERYMLGKQLCVWDVTLNNQDIADLSIILEKRGRTVYPFTHLELLDCGLDVWSMERLGKAVNLSSLTSLNLDYNTFGEEGVQGLLHGLAGNNQVVSLSLCYCHLGPGSGSLLAALVTKSAIRDLYVNGNELQSEGSADLVREMAEYAENVALGQRADVATVSSNVESKSTTRPETSVKKKKKAKGKKSKIAKPPEIGPWLAKLHLADNGIDDNGKEGITGPLKFAQVLCQLIKFSGHFIELDLDDNSIGELCGKLILETLKERKEAKLPCLKINVTAQMSEDTFGGIFKNTKKLKSTKRKKAFVSRAAQGLLTAWR